MTQAVNCLLCKNKEREPELDPQNSHKRAGLGGECLCVSAGEALDALSSQKHSGPHRVFQRNMEEAVGWA